jgi:hypothetical protein
MWKTRDGQQLRVIRSDLRHMNRRLRQQRRKPRAREDDLSLMYPLARLARKARQVGIIRHPTCGCGYPVFASQLGRRRVHLVTRPLAGGGNAIVSIRIIVRGAR